MIGNFLHQTKGYVMTGIAFAACPCHLPITLPILISLTAGTALGAWLEGNTIVIAAALTVIFIGGLLLGLRWIGSEPAPNKNTYRARTQRRLRSEPIKVTLITSQACGKSCAKARVMWQSMEDEARIQLEEVDISSARGRALAARYNIFSTPTTIINGRVAFRSVPRPRQVTAALNT